MTSMTQRELIDTMIASGVLRTQRLIDAFNAVDRRDFVPEEYTAQAYHDRALPIEGGQTISQPSTIAFMLELLDPRKGHRILDVGSGSGYTTALLSEVVGDSGAVFGVEAVPELVAAGSRNLAHYHFSHATISPAGPSLGLPEKGPFDRILVSAGTNTVPEALVDQLKTPGILVIPIQDGIECVTKTSSGDITSQHWSGFAFVPLRL